MDQDANIQAMLQAGIKTAQAKRKQEAYQILSQVVRRDPQSEQGWLWLAAVAPTPNDSLAAFNRVLEINPNNEQARVGRRWAQTRIEGAAAAPATPAAPERIVPAEPAAVPATAEAAPPVAPEAAPNSTAAVGAHPGTALSSESLMGVFAPAGTISSPASAAPPAVETPAPPAGTDWRASGDRSTPPSSVNWDDDGAGLQTAGAPSTAGAVGVTCPNCGAPGQTGAVCSLCNMPLAHATGAPETTILPTDELYRYSEAGATTDLDTAAMDEALAAQQAPVDDSAAPVPAVPPEPPAATVEPYSAAIAPVGRGASILPLVLGLLLLLVGLAVLIVGWTSLNQPGYFDRADVRFFQAQMQPNYQTAASLLVPDLQSRYTLSNDLPDIKLAASLAALGPASSVRVQGAPLAMTPDGKVGESVVTLQPASGAAIRYLVHLTNSGGTWLIDQVQPYPASSGTGATP